MGVARRCAVSGRTGIGRLLDFHGGNECFGSLIAPGWVGDNYTFTTGGGEL